MTREGINGNKMKTVLTKAAERKNEKLKKRKMKKLEREKIRRIEM